jgi:E3 ubiquitin-protein ligase RNF216
MIQCPEAHLFCSDCMNSYVENLLGSHNSEIICMDQSGCKLSFPVSELRRFLPDKLLDLYERVKQRKEIELAGLDGLEECPFCDYKCVIENPDEKLFRCGNEEVCGAVTCRQCKKMVMFQLVSLDLPLIYN